jgi:hypothetical protein
LPPFRDTTDHRNFTRSKRTTTMTKANQELSLDRLDQVSGGTFHRPVHVPPWWVAAARLEREIGAQVKTAVNGFTFPSLS